MVPGKAVLRVLLSLIEEAPGENHVEILVVGQVSTLLATLEAPTPPGGRQHERRHAIGQLLRRVGQAPRPQAAAQGVVSRTSLVPPASSYQLRHRAGAYSRPYIPAYSLTAQGDSRGAQPTDARDRVDKRAPWSGGRGGVKVRVLRDRTHTHAGRTPHLAASRVSNVGLS